MSRVWLCSDTHLGHSNIPTFRWKSNGDKFFISEEHDEYITSQILGCVGKRDVLIIAGDVCFTKEAFKHIRTIASAVQTLKIVIGNHDFERSGAPTVEDYREIGATLHSMIKYKGYWITHAPIHPDELRGKKNIHGHVHYCDIINDERYVNVCMESEWCNFKPIDFQNIKNNIRNSP